MGTFPIRENVVYLAALNCFFTQHVRIGLAWKVNAESNVKTGMYKCMVYKGGLMKVVAFNGSPKAKGNTYHAIRMVADEPEAEEKVFTHFIR